MIAAIPAINGMVHPGAMDGRIFVDEYVHDWWCNWSAVKVKSTMKLCPCCQCIGVKVQATHQIKHKFSLRYEAVPEMDGEIFIHTAQPSNEMIFECADSLFGGIALVEVWWDQLELNTFMMEILLECMGDFIVKALEFWL